MRERYLETLRSSFEGNLEKAGPIQKMIRQKAWELFCTLGLPEKSTLGFQYFPFLSFYKEAYTLADLPTDISAESFEGRIFPECLRSHIVMLNGQYVPELSDTSGLPEEVVVLRLKDALGKFGNLLQERLSRGVKEETDPFAALNIALIQMGVFIFVPPKVEVKVPLQILSLLATERPTLMSPRVQLHMGARSSLKVIGDVQSLRDFDYFSNGVFDAALEEGADLEHYAITCPSPHGWYMEAIRVQQKRESRYRQMWATVGAQSIRQDIRVSLVGENASCDVRGIGMLSENRQAHINVHIDHKAPHCRSNQLFKNTLSGTSRSSFEGKIYVHPEAQKTEAYQLNHNLILDDRASANCKPNLEIYADDVKASHGATVSQLDPKHLFYLKTRGITPLEGRELLLLAFSADMLNGIEYTPVRDQLIRIIG